MVKRIGCCGRSLRDKHSKNQTKHGLGQLLLHLEHVERENDRFVIAFSLDQIPEGETVEANPAQAVRQRGRAPTQRRNERVQENQPAGEAGPVQERRERAPVQRRNEEVQDDQPAGEAGLASPDFHVDFEFAYKK